MMAEKLYPKIVNIFKNGAFGVSVANGQYPLGPSPYNLYNAYSITANKLVSNATSTTMSTLVTSSKIDVTDFSTLRAKVEGGGEIVLDITSISGEAYVYLYSTDVQSAIGLSTTQTNFASTGNRLAQSNQTGAFNFTEITLEP